MNDRTARIGPLVRHGALGVQYTTAFPGYVHEGRVSRYQTATVLTVLCLMYFDIPSYVYGLNESFLPKYFFYAFFIVLLPLLLARPLSLTSFLLSPFSLWAFSLIALNLLHLVDAIASHDQSRVSFISTRAEYLLLAVILGFACSITRLELLERIFPLLAVTIPVLVLWDFINPGTFYSIDAEGATLGRGAATFINSNKAGEAMLLTLLLAIPPLRPYQRAVLLLLVGAGVIVTFSRAAILGWIGLWGFLVVRREVPRYTLVLPLMALTVLPLLLGTFENYLSGREDLSEGIANIQGRLEFFENRVADDASALERMQVLQAGEELFWQNPLIGAGAGATETWGAGAGTHNLVVMLAAEYGVIGIAVWLWLAVILARGRHFRHRSLNAAAVVLFVFLSMFKHNVFDTPYWLVTFAILAEQRRT